MKLTVLRQPAFWITTAALLVCWALPAHAVRIKDIATFSGVRDNQLIGYGLVVGLDGTGDSSNAYTTQSLANYLQQMGLTLPPGVTVQPKNVAAVLVTAELPAFARPGQTIDVTTGL